MSFFCLRILLLTVFMGFFFYELKGEEKQVHHLIMYGQSLSIGYQSYPVISTENIPGNYMVGDQVWINYGNTKNLDDFYPLAGSIGNSYLQTANLMSRTGYVAAECPLLGMVNHLQLKLSDRLFLATSCGTSGRSIEELSLESETKNHYADYSYSLKAASLVGRKKDYSITCPAICWMQGEWNYSNTGDGLVAGSKSTSDKNEYKSLLLNLKDNMQQAVLSHYAQEKPPLFITYQAGAQYTKGKEVSIGMAQLEASNEHPDIVCAGPVYPMTDRGGHLDSNGYRWFGEMLAKVYYKTQVKGEDFKPLQPDQITRTPGAKSLTIRFRVPVLPLVLDDKLVHTTINYGFSVYKNGVKQLIYRVAVDNDRVVIDCAESLDGSIEVVYAGESTAGHGNLRDSDPYQAYFSYVDLDKKNEDGSFFYPREESETTLRPNYEPKDGSGKVIYDQAYPLYNWSVAFYYRLADGVNEYQVPGLGGSSALPALTMDKKVLFHVQDNRLSFLSAENEEVKIGMYDLSGKCICSVIVLQKEYWTLPVLAPGAYVINAISGSKSQTEKIIINR